MSWVQRLNNQARQAFAFAIFLIAACAGLARATPSFAFYYGPDIPWESLGAFDVAVVEPGHVGASGWAHRLNPDTTVAAYVSVGEVHPGRGYFAALRPEWKLGTNAAWGSVVVDQAAPGWPAFYVDRVVKPLWEQGYRAFFLDTMDSFHLVAKTDATRDQQVRGLAAVVRAIKSAYPGARLIFNRGFEVLPEVHTLAYAVAAESLFQGHDAGQQKYRAVPPADREWLLGQLLKCRDTYRLPVIAIDYVPPNDRVLARETARQIRALGIVPWVTNPALDMMGVGQVEVLPRQVLAIHDQPGHLALVASHEIHRVGTMPLNHLGLDARYVYFGSPELEALSGQVLAGRYAGIVTWFNRGSFQETPALMKLINNARSSGVPVVLVGDMPSDAAMDAFGKDIGNSVRLTTPLTLDKRSPHVGFEVEPKPNVVSFTPSALRPGQGEVWLRVHSQSNGDADVIAITPWGGFAAERYWKIDLPQDNGERWVVNPIEFFRAALKLRSDIPVPDVTTDTGRRMLMIHVDGDGFPSRAEIPGAPLASEVMYREFLQRYKLPSTVSIIEGEVSGRGLFAALAPAMEQIARQIFALPHVEMASHSYSHPFFWAESELGQARPGRAMGLRLPGYQYSAEREVIGSRDYINSLAPPGKRTRVLLWSGDTQPLETPVRLSYQAGLLNMNSGNTWMRKSDPSLTLVGPLGMMKGDWYQVYAPMQNENVYTNDWTGPFYGFERVIETFEMTETPHRLKPVNIYYHTYIASKRASIASLHKAYGWAEDQLRQNRLNPVYASEYIERVLDWRRATVALTDQGLELRSGTHLRQWRVDASVPAPLVDTGAGLAGYQLHAGQRYLHATKSIATYAATTRAGGTFYLESANGRLLDWQRSGPEHRFRFSAHVPLQVRFFAPGCTHQAAAGQRSQLREDRLDIETDRLGPQTVVLRCAG